MDTMIKELFNLDGKVAIITGGAGLLGTEYATVLGAAGAAVAFLDIRSPSAMRRHAAALRRRSLRPVLGLRVDITKEREVRTAVGEIMRRFKRIDILINNAALTDISGGGDRFSRYEKFPDELFQRELEVTLTGAFRVTKAALPAMMRRRRGVIVNISSIYGVSGPDNRIYPRGRYRSLGYATAKSGILNFTRALASYLAPHGIRVNTLTLGGVCSGQDRKFLRAYGARAMLGRMARAEEVRGPMLFLCSDASSYMTGANLIVDGGWTAW